MIGQAVSEKKIFENGGRRTTDGRTPDHGHPISSPCEPDGSGELKKWCNEKITVYGENKAQVGKDQEKAQSEKDSHSKNRCGKISRDYPEYVSPQSF